VGFLDELPFGSGTEGVVFSFFTVFEVCESSISSKLDWLVITAFFGLVGDLPVVDSFLDELAIGGTAFAGFLAGALETFAPPSDASTFFATGRVEDLVAGAEDFVLTALPGLAVDFLTIDFEGAFIFLTGDLEDLAAAGFLAVVFSGDFDFSLAAFSEAGTSVTAS
jgi:hypothetical protein